MERDKLVRKQLLTLGILLLLLVGAVYLLGISFMPKDRLVITAYDGPVASMSRIEHKYPTSGGTIVETVSVNYASVYPDVPDIFDIGIPSGLKCEINTAPNVGTYEEIDTISKFTIDDAAKTNTSENVAVQKVKGTMGIKISTSFGGLADAYDTKFWIKLQENDFSVFQGVDDSYAAFLEVYTIDPPNIYGDLDVVPSAGGANIPMEPLGEQPQTPEWISRIYGGVENLRIVEFPIEVLRGHAAFGIPSRSEAYADYVIGFDVLLFGYWKQTHDYRKWDAGIPDFWGDLIATLASFMWYVAGIVLSALAIWKLKGRQLILVLAIVWVLVLWMSGFLPDLLEQFGVLTG